MYWLRLLCLTFPGYLHPDEFFQNTEVAAYLVSNRSTLLPWEFSCEDGRLYRSIVGPMMTSGLSYTLLSWLGLDESGYAMFYAPRVVMFFLSLCMDWLVRQVFGQRAYYVYRTSWVSVLLFTHTFSNVLESFLLTTSFYLAHRRRSFLLGFVSTAGSFNRITFPMFVFPVYYYFLRQQDESFVKAFTKKRDKRPGGWVRFGNIVSRLALTLVGATVSLILHIIADSVYAHYTPACNRPLISFGDIGIVLTPLNSLLYNSDVGNLAHHGLHPVYTHVVLNMQLLFSPIWLFTMLLGSSEPTAVQIRHTMLQSLKAVCFTSLATLSAFPHQEARFLIPLLTPVAVITSDAITMSGHTRFYWKVFNTVVGAFFGFVHQAGVVRALFFVEKALRNGLIGPDPPTCLATYGTYSAPRSLLGEALNRMDSVVDLGSANLTSIKGALAASDCPVGSEWLVMVPSAALEVFGSTLSEDTQVTSFFPHLSMEFLPDSWSVQGLSLQLHRFNPDQL